MFGEEREDSVTDDPVSEIMIQYPGLLFPMSNYCILIGCSLHTKSDIMQDDVNCPITLSWKRWWRQLTNNTKLETLMTSTDQ